MINLFRSLGITKSDTVHIQANVVNLLNTYKCSVKDILDSLIEVSGTVVFPAFMRDYKEWQDNGFNILTTPSRMGVLSEEARKHPKAVRSGHPLFSFVSIGDNSQLFNVNNFSGYGKDSPFSILLRLKGKVMVIGLINSHGNSLFHHIEEMFGVPYRTYRLFRGQYTDRHGQTGERIYSFFGNSGVKTLLDPMDNLLWKGGLYRGCKPYDGHGVRVIDANKMFDFTWDILSKGKAEGLLYERH